MAYRVCPHIVCLRRQAGPVVSRWSQLCGIPPARGGVLTVLAQAVCEHSLDPADCRGTQVVDVRGIHHALVWLQVQVYQRAVSHGSMRRGSSGQREDEKRTSDGSPSYFACTSRGNGHRGVQ